MTTFDPQKYMIKVQGGKQYLPVSARLIWFRSEHPNWGISTEIIGFDPDKKWAFFKATVTDEQGRTIGVGSKFEDVKGFPDYSEKAETGAIGRALATCGYGTQFDPSLDGAVNVDHDYGANNSRREPDNGHSANTNPRNATAAARPADVRQPEPKPASAPRNDGGEPPPEPPFCFDCGTQIKPSQAEVSLRNYGMRLCPEHQKGAQRINPA
jgi:hypothetical protein